jgi:hypothetical protein
VFGIFGAAIAAAKIQGLDADQVNGAIAQCVNLAAGNLEGARSGGRSFLFGPRVTIFTKDGRRVTKEGTGREFIWDFEEEARRIRPVSEGTGLGDAQFAELIDACRRLDGLDGAARTLISLTIRR